MSVKITCPKCSLERSIAEHLLGSRARCPNCRTVFLLGGEPAVTPASGGETSPPQAQPQSLRVAPQSDDLFAAASAAPAPTAPRRPGVRALSCPLCSKRFGVPEHAVGLVVACPHCRGDLEVGPDDVRPASPGVDPEAGTEADLDLAAFNHLGAGPSHQEPDPDPTELSFDAGPAAAEPGEDFTALLNARRTARPAPAPQPQYGLLDDAAATGRKSRYGGPAEAARGATVDADCVIRPFFCPEFPEVGEAVTAKLEGLLTKEGDPFGKVVVADSDLAWGRRITIEDSGTSAAVNPGSLLRHGSVHIQVTATIHLPGGATETVEVQAAQVAQRGMGAKATLDAAVKSAATKLGNAALKATTGAKHLRSEISGYATATLIFGLLGAIPFLGWLMAGLALITGLVVFAYNRGRAAKVGLRRTWAGLIVGGAFSALWAFMVASGAVR